MDNATAPVETWERRVSPLQCSLDGGLEVPQQQFVGASRAGDGAEPDLLGVLVEAPPGLL